MVAAAIFALSLALRWDAAEPMPPLDDLYHAKRIAWSAEHFPRVLDFDPDRGERGAFTPWPPLYDLSMAALAKCAVPIEAMPPIAFSLFAALIGWRFGVVAGAAIALAPYLIGISRSAHIDHHWLEPPLALAIAAASIRRRPLLLGIAITVALFVQPALIVAAGLAFVVAFVRRDDASSFVIPAAVVMLYALTRPGGYPQNAWFLGWPYVALLMGAAVAVALAHWNRALGIAGGAITALAISPAFLEGTRFFGGHPWLTSIVEFQPMFRDPSRIGTDLANLGGGALLAFAIARRHPTLAFFSITYLVLALTSRRFLIVAIPFLIIAGVTAMHEATSRVRAAICALLVLLPPLTYDVYKLVRPEPPKREPIRELALRLRPLPPGRVLAPWPYGHAIDVLGKHAVVIDNFGSMPDEQMFLRATDALLQVHENELLRYCRERGIRYLALPDPAVHVAITASAAGIELPAPLIRRTVWWRLHAGGRMEGFTRVDSDVWEVSDQFDGSS